MVLHVVLFRPRPELSAEERAALVEALEEALHEIPSIRRVSLGRRLKHGAGYEALMSIDMEFAAVLEFDDAAGLRAYLEHPAHRGLGPRFMQSLESSAIYDYAILSADDVRALAGR